MDDQVIKSYASPTRGAILVYPVVTKGHPKVSADALDPSDVHMCFELWAPLELVAAWLASRSIQSAEPGRLRTAPSCR